VSKFLCRCSHVISLISSPTKEQFTLVPNTLLYDLGRKRGQIYYSTLKRSPGAGLEHEK
jgi:hypothetical protein